MNNELIISVFAGLFAILCCNIIGSWIAYKFGKKPEFALLYSAGLMLMIFLSITPLVLR